MIFRSTGSFIVFLFFFFFWHPVRSKNLTCFVTPKRKWILFVSKASGPEEVFSNLDIATNSWNLCVWRDVQGKRRKRSSAEKSPPHQNPGLPRDQCLIVYGLRETRADTGSLETRQDIDELSKVIKYIVPPGKVIIILKTHRLCPRVANLPHSSRPLKVVLSETAMRDL